MPSIRLKWHTSTVGTLRWKSQENFWSFIQDTDVPPLRYGGREGEWRDTYLSLVQHFKCYKFQSTPLPGDIAKATEGELKKCKTLVLCMLLKMCIFAVASEQKRQREETPAISMEFSI